MTFSKSLVLILALLAMAMPLAAQMNSASSPTPCSLASLKGGYGALDRGTALVTIPGLPTPPYAVAITAIVNYDGAGHLSGTATASFGGVIIPGGTFTGTYKVKRDCTYSDEFATSLGTLHHAGAITGEGMFREIHYVYIDPGFPAYGTARKTPLDGCSLAKFNGRYAVFGDGIITVQLPGFPPPPVFLTHVGIFTAEGGQFSGKGVDSVDGAKVPSTFSGTAVVNSDCTGTATIIGSDGSVTHEEGTFTGTGRFQEFHGIVTDEGWVLAEAIKKR